MKTTALICAAGALAGVIFASTVATAEGTGGTLSMVQEGWKAAPAPSGKPAQPQAAYAPGAKAGAGQGTAGGAQSDEALVDEVARARAEQQSAWQVLNNLNPFSGDYAKAPIAPSGSAAGTADAAAAAGPFEQLNRLLSQPAVQGYLKLFSNPTFSRGIDQLIQSPHRMTLLYIEIGFAIFMLFFRAWRQSKSTHWLKRIWTSVWTFGLFWIGAVIVIPWIVLGDAYYQTIAGLLDVMLTSMKSAPPGR